MPPRTIWILWFQGWDRAPEIVSACRRSWEDLNPGWDVRALSNAELPHLLGHDSPLRANAGAWFTPQAHSDLVRIDLLARYGGVLVDATALCAKPLDDWLPDVMGSGFFAFDAPAPDRMISSWFLAFSRVRCGPGVETSVPGLLARPRHGR